jgi:hypothetical protein
MLQYKLKKLLNIYLIMTIKEMKDREMKRALKLCKTVEIAAKKLGISSRLLYLFKKKNKL